MQTVWTVGLFLLAACGPQMRPSAGELAMTDKSVLNSGIYGDSQNRSFQAILGRVKGEELYHAKAMDIAQPASPLALSVAGDKLVIGYGNQINCLSRADGKLLWNRSIRGNHIFEVTKDGILTLDFSSQYVLLSLNNEPSEEIYLASVHEQTFLHSVATLADGSWAYVVEQYPEQMSEPDEEPEEPATRFVRYHPEEGHVYWEFVMPPEPRGVAVTEDGARIFVAYATSLYSIPVGSSSDDEVTITEFTDIRSLSTDGQGNALVVEIIEDTVELKQIKPDGSIGWMESFNGSDVSSQPPASSPDGFVYIVVHNTLHQVKDGDLIWSYPLKANTNEIKITVLADNSVLVAAGIALVHVSATGEEILTKWLDTTIRTRPIMDENERVYFGADDGIHCIK
jgi:outer membrane protein assembly factor BamB